VRNGPDTDTASQSKLSPQQLEELQKSTHFDKKELQQWYKGTSDTMVATQKCCVVADVEQDF
jgi:hypothetical protein